jgi:hypothetical protein
MRERQPHKEISMRARVRTAMYVALRYVLNGSVCDAAQNSDWEPGTSAVTHWSAHSGRAARYWSGYSSMAPPIERRCCRNVRSRPDCRAAEYSSKRDWLLKLVPSRICIAWERSVSRMLAARSATSSARSSGTNKTPSSSPITKSSAVTMCWPHAAEDKARESCRSRRCGPAGNGPKLNTGNRII